MTDQWTDRLSDYIDDELTPGERAAARGAPGDVPRVRGHARRAARGRRARRRADAAAARRRPVAGHRAAPRATATVTPFQPRRAATRRFSFTMPQLVAAGLALMVMSGGGVWVLQHGGRATDTPSLPLPRPAPTPTLAPASLADPRYDEAIADLEQALEAGRADLDPGHDQDPRSEPRRDRQGDRPVAPGAGGRSRPTCISTTISPTRGSASSRCSAAATAMVEQRLTDAD